MLSDQSTMLNEVLSRYIILRHHLQQSHWFVEGPFFFSWHEMFEKHYNQLNEIIDTFAETLRIHKVLAPKKMGLMSLEGQEPEVSSDKQGGLLESLLGIAGPLKKLISSIVLDPQMANFATIVDELTEHLAQIDKMCWFYEVSKTPIKVPPDSLGE